MKREIVIGEGLVLPLDAITNTFAVFGIRGSGKSNCGAVMAEGIIEAGQPICVIDPTGAWYGLKSSADGKAPGLPVYVFGGEHADIPLEPGAGEVLARFVVEKRVPTVLDLKLMRKHEQLKFVVGFAETLFHINREPLMVFVDEAARFAPQVIKDKAENAARCLGAMEDLSTLGRTRGLGVTLLAQRPAPVSTTLRTQVENLICLRTIGKHDRKAIDEWVEAKGTQKERDQMMQDLAELPDGVGYFWSPSWLRVFRKTQFHRRRTFDSGQTPKVGQRVLTPARFAEIDKSQLSADIQAAVARAKAEDPKELRKEIARLRAELAVKEPIVKQVMVPMLPKTLIGAVRTAMSDMCRASADLAVAAQSVGGELDRAESDMKVIEIAGTLEQRGVAIGKVPVLRTMLEAGERAREAVVLARKSEPGGSSSAVKLSPGEQAVLTVCAQYPEGATRDQLTVLTGYKRSSRDTYVQRLREKGFVKIGASGAVVITREGKAALGPEFEPLPEGEALREYWLGRLPEGERHVLMVVIAAYPRTIRRERIDELTEYKRSSRDTYLQRLRSRQLVELVGRGEVKASDLLF